MTEHEDVGYLTEEQFNRFGWAVHNSRDLIPWLRVAGFIRSADADVNVRGTNLLGHVNLSGPYLAADAITRLLQELNRFPELEDAANNTDGSQLALTLTREVESAKGRWPLEERPHYVQWIRCPECSHMALRYHPPRFDGDRIAVKCMLCHHVAEEDVFSAAAYNQEKELARRLGDGEGSGDENEQVA